MNNLGLLLTSSIGSGTTVMVVYLILIVCFFYFFLIRPQNKEKKEKQALLSTLEIGDSILTSSGFYGTVIDVSDDTVIVEFGNNKNCRIPMQKEAIVQIEKPEDSVASVSDDTADDKKGKSKK